MSTNTLTWQQATCFNCSNQTITPYSNLPHVLCYPCLVQLHVTNCDECLRALTNRVTYEPTHTPSPTTQRTHALSLSLIIREGKEFLRVAIPVTLSFATTLYLIQQTLLKY